MAPAKWRIIFTTFFTLLWLYAITLCIFSVREAWKGGYGRVHSLIRSIEIPTAAPAAPLLLLPALACQSPKSHASRNLMMFAVGLMVVASSTVCMSVTLAVIQERSLVGLESRLRVDLTDMYGHESVNNHTSTVFTQAMDYAQYTFQCCGVKGDEDYLLTKWFMLGAAHGPPRLVPPSCCIPETLSPLSNISHSGSPISVVSRVFYGMLEEGWQKPQPKHGSSCQSTESSEYTSARNRKGCLKDIEELVRQEMAFSLIIAGSVVVLEMLGVVLALILRRQITLVVEEERNKPDN